MTDTINNVPRELLEDCLIAARGPINGNLAERLSALLSAPSPAGVDGLEVYITDCATCVDVVPAKTVTDAKVVLAKDAQSIIDGLRGEVDQLQSMLATVSKAGIRVRTDRDQQAKRIGELEGLLREWRRMFDGGICSGPLGTLRDQTDAALAKPST